MSLPIPSRVAVFPLVAATLAFVAGMLPALRWGAPPLPLAVAAALAVGWALLPRTSAGRSGGALLLAFGFAGAALGATARRDTTEDCRARFGERAPLEVRGVLAANAPAVRRDAPPALVPLESQLVRAGGEPLAGCAGALRVVLPRGTPALGAGTELRLVGRWERSVPEEAVADWPQDPRSLGVLRAERISVGPTRFSRHPLLALRGRASTYLRRLFPRHPELVEALVLARREGLDPELRDRFTRAGLVHLLAISGTHVGILAGVVLLLGRILGLGRAGLAAFTATLLAVYLGLIGAPASAVRAGVMICLALLGLILQRPSSPFPLLAAAALVLLAWDPLVLLQPGFQLSFAGVGGILLLRAPLLQRLPGRPRSRWRRWLLEPLVVSLAAFFSTALLVWYHFGQIAPIAIPANLIAVPVTSLALVSIVGAAALTPILPPVGSLLASAGEGFLSLLQWIADLAARSPGAGIGVARPAWWSVAAALLAAVLALEAARRLRPPVRWTVAAAAAVATLLAAAPLAAPAADHVEVHFLDVGQGDATLIRTPAGRWVVIDAGPRSDRWDAGGRRVLPFLRAHGATRVEALILTHPDADHIGGAPAVLRGIRVGRLVEPGLAVGKPLYLETLRTAEERGVPWSAARAGRTLRLDGVELELLAPEAALLDGARDPADIESNRVSAVVLLRFGGFRALFTGDLPADGEGELVRNPGSGLRVQVLKAGHHGSRTSNSAALLDAARPALVVISAGRRNRYGHPAPATLARLRARAIPSARTDREGTVSVWGWPDGSWSRKR